MANGDVRPIPVRELLLRCPACKSVVRPRSPEGCADEWHDILPTYDEDKARAAIRWGSKYAQPPIVSRPAMPKTITYDYRVTVTVALADNPDDPDFYTLEAATQPKLLREMERDLIGHVRKAGGDADAEIVNWTVNQTGA